MKKLIFKLFILVSLVFVISILLDSYLYPNLSLTDWSWGSETIYKKKTYLSTVPGKYNTLFIGSSHIYRQVNPAIFDSIVTSAEPIHSYNFGIDWMGVQESYYLYQHLMDENTVKWKYAIIELTKLKSVNYSNLHTTRIIYWQNFDDVVFSMRCIWQSSFSLPEKLATTSTCLISYIDRLINIGYLTEAFAFNSCRSTFTDKDNGVIINRGFEPYQSYSLADTSAESLNNYKTHNRFLADTTVVYKRRETSIAVFNKFESAPVLLKKYNKAYVQKLNEMIHNANQRGVQLIFLLPPRVDENQYNELLPIFAALPANNKIELSDARKYPFLYNAGNSFDETHFNVTGSVLFSTLLAQKFSVLINDRQH